MNVNMEPEKDPSPHTSEHPKQIITQYDRMVRECKQKLWDSHQDLKRQQTP
uniref:Uncharacterized protein n=1 Tax=Arion vulgaris TaxID=1028688 RepID=A0A0B7C1N6_9EUPU